ncbi:DUF2946 domain-containing protein [Paraburkholderia caribensis]|uniref:DUF2946 domain-containing protein n=1 Tax=Paraburkholderia caribensis TaxID=75105 RepID=UPI00078CD002|nr:DUF2946 domain-containing protein [Paraburkholderia caribensis]AMV48239.1 hypothetical protein ATN79_47105 [Paraburkholderia caribensis]
MHSSKRKRGTALLGLIVMWLIVLMPLVSQLVVAHRALQPATVLCSASMGSDIEQPQQTVTFDACGYCDLLATHAAMPPVPAAKLIFLVVCALAVLPTLATHFTPPGAFPSGRPRAPPSFR